MRPCKCLALTFTMMVSVSSANLFSEKDPGAGYIDIAVGADLSAYLYYINITAGTPAQPVTVQLDTGSSDLWFPATKDPKCEQGQCTTPFQPSLSSTFQVMDKGGFNVSYLDIGDWDAGDWANDTVTLGNSIAIEQQLFGIVYSGEDTTGLLGLLDNAGPETVLPENAGYPTVLDSLVSKGLIGRKAFGLYLNDKQAPTGSVTLGGVDSSKYKDDLVAFPLQFAVPVTSVSVTDENGQTTQISPPGWTVDMTLDSGTWPIIFDPSVFESVAAGFGAVIAGQGQYLVPCKYLDIPGTLDFGIGDPNGLTVQVPFAELFSSGGTSDFSDSSGACSFDIDYTQGFEGLLGDAFLRSAYVVHDITNNLTAIAQAVPNNTHTSAITTMGAGETTIPGAARTVTVAAGTSIIASGSYSPPASLMASTSSGTIQAGTPTLILGTPTATITAKSAAGLTFMVSWSVLGMILLHMLVGVFVQLD